MRKILVTGDRNWTDVTLIETVLLMEKDLYKNDLQVCHGAARGADTVAGNMCKDHGIAVTAFPADWRRYGRAAGPIRNRQMLDEFKPDIVYAFHDNLEQSRGTRDMVKIARARCIKVEVLSHTIQHFIYEGR